MGAVTHRIRDPPPTRFQARAVPLGSVLFLGGGPQKKQPIQKKKWVTRCFMATRQRMVANGLQLVVDRQRALVAKRRPLTRTDGGWWLVGVATVRR